MTVYRVIRFSSQKDDTLGLLMGPNGFMCFTLEDEKRPDKIYGETRIPEGEYRLSLWRTGRLHDEYDKRFPFHEGMIHVNDVPNFRFILWHIGNVESETAGCLLLGDQCVQNTEENGRVLWSEACYRRVYPQVLASIKAGPTYVRYEAIDG